MNINERDIFNFVFYPETLVREKNEYLEKTNLFEEEVNFYKQLKGSLSEELSAEIKNKIVEKIPLYKPAKIFFLQPVRDNIKKKKNDVLVLAADSPKEKADVVVKTFSDVDNNYLIRLVNFKESAKVFVFSTTDEVMENYRIVIQPSGKTFEQADNSSPIEIDSPIEADSIELKFN